MSIKNLFTLTFLAVFLTFSCDVDQTREGEMPEVDIDVDTEAGQMPAYDVDWADVDVSTKTKMVKVPKVRVVMEEEEVEVPVIDFDMPDAGDKEEMTLMLAAEVEGEARELDIIEVYAAEDNLYVIGELKKTGEDLGEEMMRVEDQIILNAPDLNVKYYIIGDRPDGSFNSQYRYITKRSDINDRLQNGRTIYSK